MQRMFSGFDAAMEGTGKTKARGSRVTTLTVCLGLLLGATFAHHFGPTDSAGPMTGVALILAVGIPVWLLCQIVPALWRFVREPFPPFRWW